MCCFAAQVSHAAMQMVLMASMAIHQKDCLSFVICRNSCCASRVVSLVPMWSSGCWLFWTWTTGWSSMMLYTGLCSSAIFTRHLPNISACAVVKYCLPAMGWCFVSLFKYSVQSNMPNFAPHSSLCQHHFLPVAGLSGAAGPALWHLVSHRQPLWVQHHVIGGRVKERGWQPVPHMPGRPAEDRPCCAAAADTNWWLWGGQHVWSHKHPVLCRQDADGHQSQGAVSIRVSLPSSRGLNIMWVVALAKAHCRQRLAEELICHRSKLLCVVTLPPFPDYCGHSSPTSAHTLTVLLHVVIRA